ncbi:sll0787 family AIR synthase-like protein [Lichenicoccus sp.]|uniref:sll0787 family AIR synthase-like protein n=1 Tax=Lichenicoccus sp. TaxID=2781899 RepID=UPI003D122653
MSELARLADQLRDGIGIRHKQDIGSVVARLGLADSAIAVGDDCAAIANGDGWLLLAIEGFLPSFVANEPFFAGYCGVMVNLSDIAAMGGRPLAVVDALFSRDASHAGPVLDGLARASAVYGVPVLGGHSNLRASSEQLSVAVLGRARSLLSSFAARPGETLLAAIDLRGQFREPYDWWDASSACVDPARLRGDLELLPLIAERGLSGSAKDISMGGLIGTALMLAECSGIGLAIAPALVPRPSGVDLPRWLSAFPSFGFLLTCAPDCAEAVIALFAERNIACAAIGRCERGSRVDLIEGDARETIRDVALAPLLGCGPGWVP